jgi:hypothetical protein
VDRLRDRIGELIRRVVLILVSCTVAKAPSLISSQVVGGRLAPMPSRVWKRFSQFENDITQQAARDGTR